MITTAPLPTLTMELPAAFPSEKAIRLELQEGIPVLRASAVVQRRITRLLTRQAAAGLSAEEEAELTRYEELDDYLSLLNRLTRNIDVQAGNN